MRRSNSSSESGSKMSTKERSLILSALGSDNPDPPLNLRDELQKQLLDSFFIIVRDNISFDQESGLGRRQTACHRDVIGPIGGLGEEET